MQSREHKPPSAPLGGAGSTDDRSLKYALSGLITGLFAPLGWILISTLFFRPAGTSAFAFIASFISPGSASVPAVLYMGIGTSAVMAAFGFLIGRKDSQLINEQRRMSETYKLFIAKEEMFEQRLFTLHGRMNGITNVSASIQKSATMEEVFRICADGIKQVLDFDRVNIFLANREKGMLECVEARGNLDESCEDIRVPMGEEGGVIWLSLKNDRPYVIKDAKQMKDEYRLASPYDRIKAIRSNSFMLIPFHDGKEPVGLFAVDNKFKRTPINDEEVDIIKVLADQTSVAISNIRLIHGIRRMDDLMEKVFVTIHEKREKYSGEIQKVANSTTELREAADALAADAEQILASADEGIATAKEFDNAGAEVNNRMVELMSSMDEISQVAGSMHQVLQDIKVRTEASSEADEQASNEVEIGIGVFRDAGEVIQSLERITGEFANTMDDLSRRSNTVKETIKVIDEVMDQTKLLALNASIIAAQAGSHGRSFAVVAEEIGKLSRGVEESTGAIREAMDWFERDIDIVLDGTNRIKSAVGAAVDNTARVEEVLNRIDGSFKHTRELNLVIRDEMVKQADAAVNVVDTARSVSEVATRLKEGADRQRDKTGSISSSSESMTEISYRLSQTARINQSGSRALLQTVSESEQIFETLFVSLQEWRDLGKELLKELETFGV